MFEVVVWSFLTLTTFLWYTRVILPWNEKRNCLVQLYDPVHEFVGSQFLCPDYVKFTNLLQAATVLMYVPQIFCLWDSSHSLVALKCAVLLMFARSIMLISCPLRVASDASVLDDVLLKMLTFGFKEFRNDLMFSGHISSAVMMMLTTKIYPQFFFICAILQAFFLTVTKVHYTIDVLVAPFISFTIYSLVQTY